MMEFQNALQKDPAKQWEEFWFIFKDSRLLVDRSSPCQAKVPTTCSIYMGTYRKRHLLAVEAAPEAEAPPGAEWVDLKSLFGKMDDALFSLAGKAVQLIYWDRTHQFCGRCGTKTIQMAEERAKECPACRLLAFPQLSPVIITVVQKGEEILLARNHNFPMPFYSALAGFVDPGETLEECVRREVFEEVALQVDDIRYFGSQPWPFPHSLMIAFSCQWKSGEIKIAPDEIADAGWFKKDNLPLLPPPFSIGRILIDSILNFDGVF